MIEQINSWDYSDKLNLPNGGIVKILFTRYDDAQIKINKKRTSVIFYNVALAAGRNKDISAWHNGQGSKLNSLPTYNNNGIRSLVWAKEKILEFIELKKGREFICIGVGGADSRRDRIYRKALAKMGFRTKTVVLDQFEQYNTREEFECMVYCPKLNNEEKQKWVKNKQLVLDF